MRLARFSVGIGLIVGLLGGCLAGGDPGPSSAMADGGAASMNAAPATAPGTPTTVPSRGTAGTSGSGLENTAMGSAGPPAALTPLDCPDDRTVLGRAAPATYSIVFEALSAQGTPQPVFVATAFAIGPNLLATNSHVTQGLKEFVRQIEYTDVVAVQSGTGAVVRLDLAVTHPAFTGNPLGEPDVGLLTTSSTLPDVATLAPADSTSTVHVTDEIYVIGFPGDVDAVVPTIPGETIPQATALQGNVTALRNFDPTVRVNETSTDIIQHDAATSPGMSGSPILSCGRVVGVNNAGTIKQVLVPGENGELSVDRVGVAANNFGIDIKHLHGLMRQFQSGTVTAFDLNAHPPITPAPPPPPVSSPPPASPQPSPSPTPSPSPAPSPSPPSDPGTLCNETCLFAADGECDDGGPNSLPDAACGFGTDCTDCGPRALADAPPLVPDAPLNPASGTIDANWIVFNDAATGQLCEVINGADFEAVVLAGTSEIMLVNVFDASGQALATDTTVDGLTLGPNVNFLDQGVPTGAIVQFALDADGSNRLFALNPDGTLLAATVRADLVGLVPSQFANVRCDACGAVDDPAPGRCE
jgi:V8-like Glu-specific endopeptidase